MKQITPIDYWDLIRDHPELFDNTDALIEIITDESIIKSFQFKYRQELENHGLPQLWADIGIVYQDQYVVMLRDLVKLPDGSIKTYGRFVNRSDLEGGQGIVVLPIFEGKIIILEQYRHATRSWHLELPRGFGTIGISSSENAKKEIREEIDGSIESLTDLGICYNNTGMEGGFAKLYLARLLTLGKPNEIEGIKYIKRIDLVEFEKLLDEGKINDCFTIAAYARAKIKGYLVP